MSDLQCPVSVIVLRHGQSDENAARRLSAAPPGAGLTALGRAQAAEAARSLADRHVARVFASPLLRARQTAEIVAQRLDAGEVIVLDDVREFSLGECEGGTSDADWAKVDGVFDAWLDGDLAQVVPGGESGFELIRRVRSALEGLADSYRGETVVVVSHGGAMSLALPWLATGERNDRARTGGLPNCGMAEVEGDADGWRLLSWPDKQQPGSAPYPGDLVELLGRADVERNLTPPGGGIAGADYATVAGIHCAHLPLPYGWATQASFTALTEAPSPQQLAAVTEWLDERAPNAWHIVVDESLVQQVQQVQTDAASAPAAPDGLVETLRHGVWVCESPPSAAGVGAAQVELEAAADVEEFLSVFGAELAPVVAGQLDRGDREFLVVRDGGRAVACVRLYDLAGTTYVGGITVVPDRRGEGWGLAVSALATRRALQRSPLAWLHCDDSVGALYARLGYRRVTTHVHLAPSRHLPSASAVTSRAARGPMLH